MALARRGDDQAFAQLAGRYRRELQGRNRAKVPGQAFGVDDAAGNLCWEMAHRPATGHRPQVRVAGGGIAMRPTSMPPPSPSDGHPLATASAASRSSAVTTRYPPIRVPSLRSPREPVSITALPGSTRLAPVLSNQACHAATFLGSPGL